MHNSHQRGLLLQSLGRYIQVAAITEASPQPLILGVIVRDCDICVGDGEEGECYDV